jgi:hypothetical protein
MAGFLAKIALLRKKPCGRALEVLFYAVLLLLIAVFFEGEGEFIYEGF